MYAHTPSVVYLPPPFYLVKILLFPLNIHCFFRYIYLLKVDSLCIQISENKDIQLKSIAVKVLDNINFSLMVIVF